MNSEFKPAVVAELPEGERAIQRVVDAVHRLNEAIQRAVKAGVSVELLRASRHHDGAGGWGDQMIPLVREREETRAA
jgi:hypothetical protein